MRLEVLFQQLDGYNPTPQSWSYVLLMRFVWYKNLSVSVTGAGCLRECKNTEFVGSWETERRFVKAAVSRAVRLGECPLEELPVALHSVSILRAIPCRRKLHSHIRLAAQVYPVRRQKRKRRKIYVQI